MQSDIASRINDADDERRITIGRGAIRRTVVRSGRWVQIYADRSFAQIAIAHIHGHVARRHDRRITEHARFPTDRVRNRDTAAVRHDQRSTDAAVANHKAFGRTIDQIDAR